jgi:polysaccharide export outer membrane protein
MFFASTVLLGACSGLPSDGPTSNDVVNQSRAMTDLSEALAPNYAIVDVNSEVVSTRNSALPQGLEATFGDTSSQEQQRIKPGDSVVATIWEAGTGGLFSSGASPTASNTAVGAPATAIPEQTVAQDGCITIPYAGRVKVAGQTPFEAETLIQNRLHGKAANPQVVVSISHDLGNQIAVSGDAVKGALVMLTPDVSRVLDVIAAAGGTTSPATDVQVQIVRDRRTSIMPLEDILRTPSENIQLHPGDVMIVSKNAAIFTALGATTKSAEIRFDESHVSLNQAIAKAGGLLDERADPSGVFVFRYEPSDVAARLCGECAKGADKSGVPIAYRLDMSKASSFFVAQSFEMRDHDVLFVANAEKIDLQKALGMLRDLMSPVLTGAVVTRAVER